MVRLYYSTIFRILITYSTINDYSLIMEQVRGIMIILRF